MSTIFRQLQALQKPHPKVFLILRTTWRFFLRIKYYIYYSVITLNLPIARFVTIRHKGLKFLIKTNPKNGYHDKDIAFRKVFDKEFSEYFLRSLYSGATFVDIGANIGYFSLLCAAKVGPSGRVHSFEPIKSVHDQLSQSVSKNDFNQVTTYQNALGDTEGVVPLLVAKDSTAISTLVDGIQPKNVNSSYQNVSVKKFDDIFSVEQKIDLIKIDVEGFELQVLRGMNKYLSSHNNPTLIIEYSPTFYNVIDETLKSQVIDYILSHNYSVVLLDGHSEVPINDSEMIKEGRYSTGVWNIICVRKMV